MASDPYAVLPPVRFGTRHTLRALRELHGPNSPNRYIFRIHRGTGFGAPIRDIGFIASTHSSFPQDTPINYTGPSLEALQRIAAAHITQYNDGTWCMPTDFISASYSLPYVLFECQRRAVVQHWLPPDDIWISVIDTAKIPSDAWLGTELVGAYWTKAAFFARWAQEVLVYGWIPNDAIVVTVPAQRIFDCVRPWCGEIKNRIQKDDLWSTEVVAAALTELAREYVDGTEEAEEEQAALFAQSVEQSIAVLRNTLPTSMDTFTTRIHADAVDTIARLAAMFCWWPKWITGTNPDVYPDLLEQIRQEVLGRLRSERARVKAASQAQSRATAGAVRRNFSSSEKKPYGRRGGVAKH
ncbi:hypothetical protein C8R44DRAFT_791314 [Mycena epipterygia]|nr:hypothetical protein C8R44DRAFT_791314 [Mycena epipterygia]